MFFRVFSGCFRGVFGVLSGCFRGVFGVFSGLFFPIPFVVIPFGLFQFPTLAIHHGGAKGSLLKGHPSEGELKQEQLLLKERLRQRQPPQLLWLQVMQQEVERPGDKDPELSGTPNPRRLKNYQCQY